MSLPDLSALSIGGECPEGDISQQLPGSCFFFASVASSRYALNHILKNYECDLSALNKSDPDLCAFLEWSAETDSLCVTDPERGLPAQVYKNYNDLLLVELGSGSVLCSDGTKWTDRIRHGILNHQALGVNGTGLLQELAEFKHADTIAHWNKALKREGFTHGAWLDGEFSKNGQDLGQVLRQLRTSFSVGGYADLMALAIILASNVPMGFYSDEPPDSTVPNFNHLARNMPPIGGLLVTVTYPFRDFDPDSTLARLRYTLDELKEILDDAREMSADTCWPDRELLSGIVDVTVKGRNLSDRHTVAIYPCVQTDDYKVCDPLNAECYDTIESYQQAVPLLFTNISITEIQVDGVMLFWDSKASRAPDTGDHEPPQPTPP